MTGADLRARRQRLGLNQDEAARGLGLTRRSFTAYENSEQVRRVIELAWEAYETRYGQTSKQHQDALDVLERLAQ